MKINSINYSTTNAKLSYQSQNTQNRKNVYASKPDSITFGQTKTPGSKKIKDKFLGLFFDIKRTVTKDNLDGTKTVETISKDRKTSTIQHADGRIIRRTTQYSQYSQNVEIVEKDFNSSGFPKIIERKTTEGDKVKTHISFYDQKGYDSSKPCENLLKEVIKEESKNMNKNIVKEFKDGHLESYNNAFEIKLGDNVTKRCIDLRRNEETGRFVQTSSEENYVKKVDGEEIPIWSKSSSATFKKPVSDLVDFYNLKSGSDIGCVNYRRSLMDSVNNSIYEYNYTSDKSGVGSFSYEVSKIKKDKTKEEQIIAATMGSDNFQSFNFYIRSLVKEPDSF